MSLIPYPDLKEKTDEYIEDKFKNILTASAIHNLKQFRDDVLYIVNGITENNQPLWVIESLENLVRRFLDLFPSRNQPARNVDVYDVWQGLCSDYPSDLNGDGRYYSIPFLRNYVDVQKLISRQSSIENIDKLVDKEIEKRFNTKEMQFAFEALTAKTEQLNSEVEVSLSLLNQQVGKIGVQKYADIFQKQALEHSNLFGSKGKEEDKDLGWGIGKAQIWAILSIIFICITLFIFKHIENFFPLKGALTFTPSIIANIISRVVIISLGVFLISFAFKQFRVNMHLYTLNKHRANTLKSFEYLSKAPDKLDPTSYNAILMKVAESIYEAGHTGYISTTESNHDMPSIIDMSKIITPNK